jgi:hypothetical protein
MNGSPRVMCGGVGGGGGARQNRTGTMGKNINVFITYNECQGYDANAWSLTSLL